LEWNVFFIFSLFLFVGHYGAYKPSTFIHRCCCHPDLALAMVPLGNLFPEKIRSAAMRYYAGQLGHQHLVLPRRRRRQDGKPTSSKALRSRQSAGQALRPRPTAEIMSDKTSRSGRCTPWQGAQTACSARFGGPAPTEADYSVREGEIVAGPRRLELRRRPPAQRAATGSGAAPLQLRGRRRSASSCSRPTDHTQRQWYRIVDA